MTLKNQNKLLNFKLAPVFLTAAILCLLNPTTFEYYASIWELTGAITLLWIWSYGAAKKIFHPRKSTKLEHICFAIVALFTTLSYLYFRCFSLHNMNLTMAIYCVISLSVNYVVAKYAYQLLLHFMTTTNTKPVKNTFLRKQLQKNNFWFYFAFLLIPYLAILVINYPGSIMYDPMIQILQIYKIPNIVTSYVNLVDPNEFITTHHPVIHTMLIKLFLSIGEAFGSLDLGIFFYSLFQIILMALGIAYLLKYVRKYFTDRWMLAWLLVFSLNPIVLMYSSLMTKDTLFAVLFALFGIKFFEYIKDENLLRDKKWVTSFLIVTVLCSIFRNNFFYAAFLTFVILLIVKKDKRLLSLFAIYFCIYGLYTYVLIPGLGFTGGSIREAISVAFQQTANYAKYYGVTAEEKEIISKILDYDVLVKYERPDVSNYIKDTFNKNATTKELADYFILWAKMFFKHPLAYFDAYFNQFYGYFASHLYNASFYRLPETLESREFLINAGVNLSATMPFMAEKELLSNLLMLVNWLPALYLINSAGLYIWVIMAAVATLFKRKDKQTILFYLPFLLYFGTLLLSPANATLEYRYMFPYLIAMPILIAPIRGQCGQWGGGAITTTAPETESAEAEA